MVEALRAIARVQHQLPRVETTEVEIHFLFVTDHRRQVAHRHYNFDHDSG